MTETKIVRNPHALRKEVSEWRHSHLQIAFVPTMGALHPGHRGLITRARDLCQRLCVSIFVNPKQFGPGEDLERYPRRETQDITCLREWGCDLVYIPTVEDIYPCGFETQIHVPGLGQGLCSESRPHFFSGVALIVTKLLIQVLPDVVLFGEKDYQQLQIIKRVVCDLDLPVVVEGVPTVREKDGLAYSSRNAYLSETQRKIAPSLYRILQQTVHSLQPCYNSQNLKEILQTAEQNLLREGFDKADYVALSDAQTLQPVREPQPNLQARLLAAVYLESTRLIDNVPVTLTQNS